MALHSKDMDKAIQQLELIIDAKGKQEGLGEFLKVGMKLIEEHQELTKLDPESKAPSEPIN